MSHGNHENAMSASVSQRHPIIQKLSNRLFAGPAGAIFRGMATIAFGSLIGRLIGIIVLPVLTRLYGPENFGVLAIFTAIVFAFGLSLFGVGSAFWGLVAGLTALLVLERPHPPSGSTATSGSAGSTGSPTRAAGTACSASRTRFSGASASR